MASAFGAFLYGLLEARGLTVRGFARLVGTPQPNITRIKQGGRPVPMDAAERWADALELRGEQRERFLDLAALTHADPRTQKLVAAVESTQKRTLRELSR